MADSYTQISMKVDGAPLPEQLDDALQDARIELALDIPDRATLRFRDDPMLSVSNSTTFALGKTIEVALSGSDDTVAKVFSGEITELDADFADDLSAELIVTALEKAHRLTHGNKTRTWTNVKDADVVKTIAGERGLEARIEGRGLLTKVHPYLLQSCTDFAFLSERARAAGARWFVEDDTIHFVADLDARGPVLTWGHDLRAFRARAAVAEGAVDVSVRGWDPKTQTAVNGTQPIEERALLVDSPFATQAATFGKKLNGKRYRAEASATDVSEANAAASGLVRRAAADMASARGESLGDPALKPGVALSIQGVGPRLSGSYVCTSVTHVLAPHRRFVSRFQCGGSDPRHLVDLLGGRQTRPAATGSWAERGLVIGLVTNNKDPEDLGRVKVKYPTLPAAGGEIESEWARVLSVSAGSTRGMQSIPEVQDEVLVGFEHGDTRRPVVLGGLWSGQQKPPGTKDTDSRKHLTFRVVHGSEMVLEDDKGSKRDKPLSVFRVLLAKGSGLFQLGRDGTKLESPSPITITGDKDITITAAGKLVIDAQEITLKSKTKVAVEGINVQVKASAGVKAEGVQLELKGSGSAKLEGGGMTEVKGAILKLN